ncbi:MAG: GAF domain-containing protein [Ramlibacter sp.]|nr:GAF domain-containing protein [Ramlibacter sp.]
MLPTSLPHNERDDHLLRLEHAVARQLADADDVQAALQAVIQALCETEGWEYGRFWQADEAARVLRFAASWHLVDSVIAVHMAGSETAVFKPGEGLVGRVWESGQPLWVSDLSKHSQVLGATLPPGVELHGAFMFPVTSQGRTMGVMSFVSRAVRDPEKRLLQTFRIIGTQVGQFLQRTQREKEFVLLNAELEERVRKRTMQLEAANAELEAFSYSIAHDLRSPLTSIDGFTRLLEGCSLKTDEDKARHYLRRIRAGVRQMSDLTDAMLSLARLSRVELEYEEVDLAALASLSMSQLREREPEREATVEMTGRLWVRGDPRLLAQVMTNLLGNAWKFSSRKPQVRVSIGSEKNAAGEKVYFVKDEGAGFDMAHASRLFGAFQRLHAPTEFEGTGIGLALVQKIIAGHGGRIWALARPGEGATFCFTLPGE